MIQPPGFYKQYFNLEICTWMKKSEGNVWFFSILDLHIFHVGIILLDGMGEIWDDECF